MLEGQAPRCPPSVEVTYPVSSAPPPAAVETTTSTAPERSCEAIGDVVFKHRSTALGQKLQESQYLTPQKGRSWWQGKVGWTWAQDSGSSGGAQTASSQPPEVHLEQAVS